MIVIIDYKTGNIGSVLNMLKKIGAKGIISNRTEDILNATKIILPGVGSFDKGMSQLNALGLIEVLNKKVLEEKIPVLGICLGYQLLGKSSEEGVLEGLGWINAKTVKFNSGINKDLRIPHMGWNTVIVNKKSLLFKGLEEKNKFYFVHSYHLVPTDQQLTSATSFYGQDFAAAIEHNNILGVQFHPEKSHNYGLQLFNNFINNY